MLRLKWNLWLEEDTMRRNRLGFTLIELLIVVVIIGILAAIAVPKFAATKDKAKLASIRSDLRNLMTAEEAYFSDYAAYGTFAQVQAANNLSFSTGNQVTVTPGPTGYSAVATNPTINSGITSCNVTVGGGAPATIDAVIKCP
jgi:prepilin-type N-terminal cleavage/methylation domain-containing protein